jgi:hypothetical protein
MPPLSQRRKRSKAAESVAGASAEAEEGVVITAAEYRELEELRVWRAALLAPIKAESVYDMKDADSKAQLGRDMWLGDFGASMAGLREANSELVSVLLAQVTNLRSEVTAHSTEKKERHVDGLLLDICRSQNKNRVPLIAAATSLLSEVNKVAREVHDASALFHSGTTMSEKWTTDFCAVAMAARPPPDYDVIPDVVVCCFDNLSMQIDYKSYASDGWPPPRHDQLVFMPASAPPRTHARCRRNWYAAPYAPACIYAFARTHTH